MSQARESDLQRSANSRELTRRINAEGRISQAVRMSYRLALYLGGCVRPGSLSSMEGRIRCDVCPEPQHSESRGGRITESVRIARASSKTGVEESSNRGSQAEPEVIGNRREGTAGRSGTLG